MFIPMACKNLAGMSCAPPLSQGSLLPKFSLYSTNKLTLTLTSSIPDQNNPNLDVHTNVLKEPCWHVLCTTTVLGTPIVPKFSLYSTIQLTKIEENTKQIKKNKEEIEAIKTAVEKNEVETCNNKEDINELRKNEAENAADINELNQSRKQKKKCL